VRSIFVELYLDEDVDVLVADLQRFAFECSGRMRFNSGMKPHSLELRQRIVHAVDRQLGTIEEIAEMFSVTQRYVYKLLVLRRQTGDLSPRPHAGGATAKLDAQRLLKLAELVTAQPDATLYELCQLSNRRQRRKVSLSTICRGLQKLDCTRKKRHDEPAKPIRNTEPASGASK
jgi:transposase